MNMPGTKEYDPCNSWISKMRADGRVACNLLSFVDNERLTGLDEEITWQASNTLAAKQSYLGVQDAGRKARPCSQQPGAWAAGAIVHVLPTLGDCVLTSVDKWTKLKAILKKWRGQLSEAKDGEKQMLSHKELLADRGFFVYVTRMYPAMLPYLKGFHLTIKMWRGGRDEEGWTVPSGEEDTVDQGEDEDAVWVRHQIGLKRSNAGVYAPSDGVTPPVPRFKDNIAALICLTDFKLPPLRVVRPA